MFASARRSRLGEPCYTGPWPSNTEKEINMPSERYIPDSEEQVKKWAEEREAKQKLDALRATVPWERLFEV